MAQADDLGLVVNDIVSLTKSGTGAPGTVDTYTFTLRDGKTFSFQVTNGANGSTGGVEKHEFTTVSDFTDWYLTIDLSMLISVAFFDADYNSMLCYIDNSGANTKLYKTLPNGVMQELSALSTGEKIVAFLKIDETLEFVPVTRKIAGINLENNITENALFDKMNIKGRYATLSALQTANPNHGYCYLVEANNHWYYWNNNAWTDGGLYLSDTDTNGMSKAIKSNMNGIIYGTLPISELSNPLNWEQGAINVTTGIDESIAQYARLNISEAFYAEYDIKVESLGTGCYFYFYKYNNAECTSFAGEVSQILNYQNVYEITLPKGYYYRVKGIIIPTVTMTSEKIQELLTKIAFSMPSFAKEATKSFDNIIAFEFSSTTNYSIGDYVIKTNGAIKELYIFTSNHSAGAWNNFHVSLIKVCDELKTVKQYNGKIGELEDAYYLQYGKNRNPNQDTQGYLNSTGALVVSGDWYSTDYCYVGDLESINASAESTSTGIRTLIALHFLCTYDEDKNFIEQIYTSGQNYYTIGTNVKYIRFSYKPVDYENLMVESGTSFTVNFIPFSTQKKLKKSYYDTGSNWKGLKWVAVGDSLTEANNRTLANYHDFVAAKTEITVINMGQSGTGYKNTENENKAFYQRISNVPLDTDVVTIFGSGNDMQYVNSALGDATDTGTSTLCGCINTTIDNLYAILPTVKLGIVTPCPWISYPPYVSDNLMERYSAKIVEICKLRGIPCLDLYHCSELRPWEASYREIVYSRDGGDGGVHPNEIGHKILSSHFMAFLETLISTY